jgi:V8-like Glu-specific endopeptidase
MRVARVHLRTAALAVLALDAGCAAEAARPASALEPRAQGLVYGDDDRVEYYAVSDPWLRERVAQSTVALVDQRLLTEDGAGSVRFAGDSYGELNGLCPGEPFAEQPSLAQCSGVLIDRDLVLTAAHCLREIPCEQWRAVFGFHYRAPSQLNELRSSDVYACSEVVAMDYTWAPEGGADYAILALDRPVDEPRRPAPLAQDGRSTQRGQRMIAIGHGAGIPAKIDAGGRVTEARAATLDFFVANLDGFAGGSGSGVYDEQGNLRGVLASGGDDYEETAEGCRRVRRLPAEPEQAQEKVTYLARALDGLCEADPERASLCATTPGASCNVVSPVARPAAPAAMCWAVACFGWLLTLAARRQSRRARRARRHHAAVSHSHASAAMP